MIDCPVISVLMPVYNGERFLKAAIDSILNQTFTYFEFIIINDGSTDDSEKIILSYDDPRIVYIKNEINLKLIKTLNKGVKIARGEYIARMDADDISLPTRLEKQLSFMKKNPEIGASSSLVWKISEDGKKLRKSNLFPCTLPMSCKFASLLRTPISHPAAFVKSEIMKSFLYKDTLDTLHIEAYVLWGDMIKQNVILAVLKEPLIKYRMNSNSVSHTYKSLQIENHALFARQHINNILSISLSQQQVNDLFIYSKKYTIDRVKNSIFLLRELKRIYIQKNICNPVEVKEINDMYNIFYNSILLRTGMHGDFPVKLYSLYKLIFR